MTNHFEQAFMKMASHMLVQSIHPKLLHDYTMSLLEDTKNMIDSGTTHADQNVGPILTMGNITYYGPNWHNSVFVQSELMAIVVGTLVGQLMEEFIDHQQLGIAHIFELTSSIDDHVAKAKQTVADAIRLKYGNGVPDETHTEQLIRDNLRSSMNEILKFGESVPNTSGEEVVEQLLGALADALEKRRAAEPAEEVPVNKTVH